MKFRAVLLMLCVFMFTFTAVAAKPELPSGLKVPQTLTPEFLRESCYSYGAVNTVRALTAPGSSLWAELMEHISSGDTNWIVYVPLFASGTDAGYATQLTMALARALPKNPHAVLSLEYSFVSLRNVCSMPFFDPNADFIRQYTEDVALAMREVSDPYMRMDKEICLIRLNHAADAAQKRLASKK